MEQLVVEVASGSHGIYLGEEIWDLAREFAQGYGQVVVVSDANVAALYGARLPFPSYILSPGETEKTPATVLELVEELARRGLERSSLLLALGGGVVGDLVGFAASIYLRGIDYVQIPTTLMAQVDSSVGGKTGVNLPQGKNLLGTFYQPKAVFIDPEVLKTLPPREIGNGLAEVLKYGIIGASDLFQLVTDNLADFFQPDPKLLAFVIWRCCQLKSEIVAQDERDRGLRNILNHGHTFGHALEVLTNYGVYAHGEAVLLGMLLEAQLAKELGILPPDCFQVITRGLRQAVERTKLERRLPDFTQEQLLDALLHDKKNRHRRISFILPTRVGGVKEVLLTAEELQPYLERVLEL